MRSKVLTLVGVAAVAVTAITGCSSSGKTTGSSSPSKTDSSPASAGSAPTSGSSGSFESAISAYTAKPTMLDPAPPVGKPIPKGKKFVQISNGSSYDQIYTAGLRDATAALGWQFSVLQAKLTDPSTTLSDLTTAINEKADFVLVAATPLAIYQSAIPAARAAHTLIISTAGSEPGTPPDGVVYTQNGLRDFSESGKIALDVAAADAGGKGVSLVTAEVPQLGASQPAFTSAVRSEMATKCPDCKLDTVKIAYGDILANKGSADVVAYLQTHPDTKYLLCAIGNFASGLAQAIKSAGLPAVKILGYSPGPDQLKDVADGANLAWLVPSFRLYAWESADIAARAATGVSTYDWSIGAWLIYKGNVSQINSLTDPVFPDDYQSDFKKLWGV